MITDWNNEIKTDFTVVTVPSLYIPPSGPKIFLAGSIDNAIIHWRELIIEYIRSSWFDEKEINDNITIYSPRREDVWTTDMENEQAAWDIAMMNTADYIILHLTGNTISPVSLMELGIFMTTPKLYFSVNDDYIRKNIAELYFSCYGYNKKSKSLQDSIDRIKNDWNNKQVIK